MSLNLGPDLDDVRALPKQGKRLLGSPYGTGKGARLHNPFKPLSANIGDHAEQSVPELELGRFIDKEGGIKAHNAALSRLGDSATRHFDERSFAGTLMQINVARIAPVSAQVTAARCPTVAAVTSPKPPGS